MMKYSLPGVPVKPLKATQSKLIAFCEASDDRGVRPKALHEETAICKHTSLSLSNDLPPPHFPDRTPTTIHRAAVRHILVRSERDGLVSVRCDNNSNIQLAPGPCRCQNDRRMCVDC